MGHYSMNCKLSHLPITGGTPAVLIIMTPVKNLYNNSEKSLQTYGSTCLVSNDGPRLKFIPCWFPIRGTYNDYGGLEDIIEDDNTGTSPQDGEHKGVLKVLNVASEILK